MLSYATVKYKTINIKKKKKFRNAGIDNTDKIKQKNRVTLKTHLPSCKIMKGSEQPFNSCNCGSRNNKHNAECLIYVPVNCGCNGLLETVSNTSLTLGIQLIADALIDNAVDTQVKYFEWGLGATTPTASDTTTEVYKTRRTVVQSFRSTTNAVYKSFLNGNYGNTNSVTTVSGASTTQFTLQGGQGASLTVNSQIQISGGSFSTPENTVIQTIATDTITVSPALSAVPSGGETVDELISETVLWGGSSATATQSTGTPFARTTNFTPRTKASGFGLTTEWRITLV